MTAVLAALVLAGVGTVSGTVYEDGNANGRREPGEAGLAGVVVSDGASAVASGVDGTYRFDGAGGLVFVVTPGDRRAVGTFYREPAPTVDFGLARSVVPTTWRFAHLSDTHVDAGNVGRTREAFALARDRGADFALVSGDLVKDALRVGEAEARAEFELYAAEAARAGLPVRNVLGNHDVFGIEREKSHVAVTHPVYGKRMYEAALGPRYYAFNRGRIHFIVLDTIGVDDMSYYGFLDAEQLDWVRKELAFVPAGTTVVTVGHIPLRSGSVAREYVAEGPAHTLQTVDGRVSFRHIVRNVPDLEAVLKPYRWTLALQGHAHMGERLRMEDGGITRFHTAPAVARQDWAPWPTGIVIYAVRDDSIDDGETMPLDGR
jgi:calcineurin-like phosphoesterase family protein